jgi:hypothetical protein
MGCCTLLLYRMAGASKNTVKVALTSTLLHSRLRRRLAVMCPTCAYHEPIRHLFHVWSAKRKRFLPEAKFGALVVSRTVG